MFMAVFNDNPDVEFKVTKTKFVDGFEYWFLNGWVPAGFLTKTMDIEDDEHYDDWGSDNWILDHDFGEGEQEPEYDFNTREMIAAMRADDNQCALDALNGQDEL